MSIADKITSIEGHLTDDYEGLENLGADLTNVNKNIQNIRTCLDNIYTNLPKTTGEGSNLSLTTLKGRINVDDILGDTEQDTTNGYQLIDLTLAKLKTYNTSGTWNNNVYTISGVTITINDDMSIKVNGTTTAQVGLLLAGGAIPYPTGTYYLSGAINGSNTTYDVRIFNYDGTSGVAQCFTGTKQVAIVNNSQSYNMALVVRNGVTCNNVMFYPMLSTTNTSDYEPYTNGASPNPTFPQDINVATGTQEVVVQNRNLLANPFITETLTSGVALELLQDKKIKITGTASATSSITKTLNSPIKLEASTTYTFSIGTKQSGYGVYLQDTNGNNLYYLGVSATNSSVTFTPNTDIEVAKVTLHFPSGVVMNTTIYLQLEKGSTATSYVEHQEQTKTLHLGDIELAKIGTYQDRIFETSGKQLFDKSNTSQILNAFLNGSGKTIQSNSNARTLYIPIKPSTTYTISKILSARFIVGTFESYAIGSTTTNMITATTSTSVEVTSRSNDNYLCVFYYLSTADTLSEETIRNSIMINEGSTALPYEPYGSDKWYIEKNIGKLNFTGTENWATSGSGYWYYINSSNLKATAGSPIMSNCFSTGSWGTQPTIASICQGNSLNGVVGISTLSFNSVATLKTFLSSNNVYAYAILATPTYEEITNETLLQELESLEKLYSYNGVTNITTTSDTGCDIILSVSALKGA